MLVMLKVYCFKQLPLLIDSGFFPPKDLIYQQLPHGWMADIYGKKFPLFCSTIKLRESLLLIQQLSLPDGVGEVITGQCELDVTTRLGNNYCCHKTVCRAHLQY